jgi:hypothetical protein
MVPLVRLAATGYHRVGSLIARWITSGRFGLLVVFLSTYALWFGFLYLFGPRKMVGNWMQHQPLSLGASAIVGFVIALFVTIFVYKRNN